MECGFVMINMLSTDSIPAMVTHKITNEFLDVKVSLNVAQTQTMIVYNSNNNDLVIVADLIFDDQVNDTNHCRNIVFTVQQMRKSMGLKPWDKIEVKWLNGDNFMITHKAMLEEKLGCSVEKYSENTKKIPMRKYDYSDLNGKKTEIELWMNVV